MNAATRLFVAFAVAWCSIAESNDIAVFYRSPQTISLEVRRHEPATLGIYMRDDVPDNCLRIVVSSPSEIADSVSAVVIPPRQGHGIYLSHSDDGATRIVIPSPERGYYMAGIGLAPIPDWKAVAITAGRYPLDSAECANPTPPCWPHLDSCPMEGPNS